MVTWKTNIETTHTILIVSDQPDTAASWSTLFTQRNCIVISESDKSGTLQSARLMDPSLLVVDIQLGKEEQSAFLQELRAACNGPILLLISANTIDEIIEARLSGADECLVKPVNPAVLIVKAMAWLGHGHRSEQLLLPVNVTL